MLPPEATRKQAGKMARSGAGGSRRKDGGGRKEEEGAYLRGVAVKLDKENC